MKPLRAYPFYAFVLGVLITLAALGPASSAGSVTAAPAGCLPPRAQAPGTTVRTISTANGARTYRLHVPPSYNGVDRAPVVLNFHAATSNATAQEGYTGFSTRADAADGGFIVVYPQGLSLGWPFSHFNAVELPAPEPNDVAFVTAVLDQVQAQLCTDPSRVYATGLSNGAWMSARLACSLSNRIAAVGLVAGAYYPALSVDLNPDETCTGGPVPVIAFHGTADSTIPFDGGSLVIPGTGTYALRLPIDSVDSDDVMEEWAAHNGCTGGRLESPVTDGVRLVQYDGCAGVPVELYVVEGGGHTWPHATYKPGSTTTTHDVSATDLIWKFFREHSLGGAAQPDWDGDTTPDLYDDDNDGDGCYDLNELQTARGSEITGGRRDLYNPWDFYDTDGNGSMNLNDIFDVAMAFGSDAGDGPGGRYDPMLDRSPPPPGGDPWDMQGPDGDIDLFGDILGVAAQYGHECPRLGTR